MAGQGEQGVALLRSERDELTVFPAEARKKKRWGWYLEITKGKSTPAEGVSLRERQSRAVKCSVVRGEPVDQVRGYYDHDRSMKTVTREPITWAGHASTSSYALFLPLRLAGRSHPQRCFD
jgi:hypothetical protein